MLTFKGLSNFAQKANNLDAHTASSYNNTSAGVAELADAADLKSAGAMLVGASPTLGTRNMVSNW